MPLDSEAGVRWDEVEGGCFSLLTSSSQTYLSNFDILSFRISTHPDPTCHLPLFLRVVAKVFKISSVWQSCNLYFQFSLVRQQCRLTYFRTVFPHKIEKKRNCDKNINHNILQLFFLAKKLGWQALVQLRIHTPTNCSRLML